MSNPNDKLISRVTSGDEVALQLVLLSLTDDLSRYIDRRLPLAIRDFLDVDDLVQQTFVETFRSIDRCHSDTLDSFRGWVYGICGNVVRDAIRRQNRIKRGGVRQRVRHNDSPESSAMALVEILSAGHTPSWSAMGHEAVQAVRDAIAALPADHQQAVQLHLIEGKSLTETAAVMDRTPRSVQGLLDRARQKMRDALERMSKYR